MVSEERRSEPRIHDEKLGLRLNIDGFDTVTHTLNISASGIYCKIDKEMPLMSRVKLVLMIPDEIKDEKTTQHVELEGVVVREHPVIMNGETKHYDVAIFFDNLSSKNKEIISNYIAKKG